MLPDFCVYVVLELFDGVLICRSYSEQWNLCGGESVVFEYVILGGFGTVVARIVKFDGKDDGEVARA